jgi:hypothetical protein
VFLGAHRALLEGAVWGGTLGGAGRGLKNAPFVDLRCSLESAGFEGPRSDKPGRGGWTWFEPPDLRDLCSWGPTGPCLRAPFGEALWGAAPSVTWAHPWGRVFAC